MTRAPGISIVLPTYNDSVSLASALRSVAKQTLPVQLIEVVVVFNGTYEKSRRTLEKFRVEHPELKIVSATSTRKGAGCARNIGLSLASRPYVTFLDDDDTLEERFLEHAWSQCGNNSVVLLGIKNVSTDGDAAASNSLDARISPLQGRKVPVASIPWALGFNASKVFPAKLVAGHRFEESLRSGEDVVFFSKFLEHPGLEVRIPASLEGARYCRTMTHDSVSRQTLSFDFAVRQRLECISKIQPTRALHNRDAVSVAKTALVDAQFEFVRSYLEQHPHETDKAIETAVSLGVAGLPWAQLRHEPVRRAVISYCFPPFADTAGNVAAKRIRERGEIVDVFSANMSRVRKEDPGALLMVEEYLGCHEILDVTASFARWFFICNFAVQAALRATKRGRKRGGYQSLYTRSMWSGSHVAGVLLKRKNHKLYWEAEFSDPMRLDAQANEREGEITFHPVTIALRKVVAQAGIEPKTLNSHFALTEAATFVLADELVFTNDNQRELMLAPYPENLRQCFRSKSRVVAQSRPDGGLYDLVESKYFVDGNLVNIGYFGTFYENRGVGDVVKALQTLPQVQQDRVRLHIFCPNPEQAQAQLWMIGAPEQIVINPTVPYLEFLNLATKFDALLVNDTDTSGTSFNKNPFLPSKYADYVGAGVAVWGIVTEGSPLSELLVDVRSHAGDIPSIAAGLKKIINET